ncbi:MAG: hypothetical protein QOD00_2920 [Blastocatellia bacterium]|nr:hypothetical protein [Blastocatellia bacterium]
MTANALGASTSSNAEQIAPLVTNIEQAYAAFLNESSNYSSASEMDTGLLSALYFARAAGALASGAGPGSGVQNRLQITAYRLGQVKNLLQPGSVAASLNAHFVATSISTIIGPADTRSGASLAPVLSLNSLAIIMGDPVHSPLAMTTSTAVPDANGALPYELAGVSVTIGGRAAPLVSVSPSKISFYVPQGLNTGGVEVLVTLQEGYVSRGTTSLNLNAPGLFTVNESGTGAGLALNATTNTQGAFDVVTTQNLSTDKRTRLLLYTTGISGGGVLNTNPDNDVRTSRGVIANLAESVSVEALTRDGRVLQLPVEFAGAQGGLLGLDQVNVILLPELRGAGSVELTLIAGGQRSNSMTVMIK